MSKTVVKECGKCNDCGSQTGTCYNTNSKFHFTVRKPNDTCDEWNEEQEKEGDQL